MVTITILTFGKGTTKREREVIITIPFKALSRHLPASQVHLLSALHVRMMNTHTCVLLKMDIFKGSDDNTVVGG